MSAAALLRDWTAEQLGKRHAELLFRAARRAISTAQRAELAAIRTESIRRAQVRRLRITAFRPATRK